MLDSLKEAKLNNFIDKAFYTPYCVINTRLEKIRKVNTITKLSNTMGKAKQLEKNLKLSEKLAEYIASNPVATKNIPSGASFVVFSAEDEKLNKLNKDLVNSLKREGKEVIKATEKKSKKQPWIFGPAI